MSDLTTRMAYQLDYHWTTQLRPRLEGLTDEEYFWQPVPDCWTVHPDGAIDFTFPQPQPAPFTTIAWRLAQKGFRVTIADAGNLGGEASPAGAGMLSPGAEFHQPSVWLDLGIESMRLYPAFVEELRAETGIDVDFRTFHPEDGIVDPAALLRALQCACESRKVRITREHVTAVEPREYAAVVIAAGSPWGSPW